MLSLSKGYSRSANTGAALPTVYKSFAAEKVIFRRSATSMIAGPPGGFKSALALNLLVGWVKQGMTGLYFSADADEMTTAKRAGAILTGHTVETVEDGLRSGLQSYREALTAMDGTRWIYKTSDIEEIDRQVRGFEAVYGEFPDVIVIDNLLNMQEAQDDWAGCRQFIIDLDQIARASQCHVLVLHHTSESAFAPGQPPPRSSIMGKLAQFPRLILTVGVNESTLNVAVVKNTNGPQDPTGATFFPLTVDAEKMTITDSGLYTQQGWV